MEEKIDPEKLAFVKDIFPQANFKKIDSYDIKQMTKPLKGFPRTWNYNILGNKDASSLFSQYIIILTMHYSDKEGKAYEDEEEEAYKKGHNEWLRLQYKHDVIILEKCYSDLLLFVESKHSRLAYQVLGVFLMKIGAIISGELKSLILENSRWEDDRPYLKDRKHQQERRKYLEKFRARLQNYNREFDPSYGFLDNDPCTVLPAIYHLKYKPDNFNALVEKEEKRRARVAANLQKKPLDLDKFIKELREILENPASDKGTLRSQDYIFIFRDWSEVPDELHQSWSHKVFELGEDAFGAYFEKKHTISSQNSKNRTNYIGSYLFEKNEFELKLMGALKTLAPKLEFGGQDVFFRLWMFVKTPDGKRFPADIYYGPTGLAIGAWSSYFDDKGNFYLPHKIMGLIKGSPHEFNGEDRQLFLEALESALSKVSISDFEGKFKYDGGCSIWGIKNGRPYSKPC